MLTRFVRRQLIVFTIASVLGVTAMVFHYMQVPTLLGIGRMTVTLELPATGGLYRFSNVSYRGVEVGKVTEVELVAVDRVHATLSLSSSLQVPADLVAQVRSISAIGEQYVDLQPRTDAPPYLRDGSVIAMGDTTVPQQIGPVLDQVSALVDSIPKDQLGSLLDESYAAFNGAGYDFGSLLDSTSTLTRTLGPAAERIGTLVEDSEPLLESQAQAGDSLRTLASGLAGVTEQLRQNDPEVRTLLNTGPAAVNEVTALLDQIKPTLPILLSNLSSIGQVALTYNSSLEQLLVLLPPYVAGLQTYGRFENNPTGYPSGEFAITVADPPACTVGFLPPSQHRSPADTTTVDTPEGLYCKLPQDSPITVRGARNYPCIEHPGKRAPTVELCNSDQQYQPLAMRQHTLGPSPLDPNLIAQGVPPDDRVEEGFQLYGPPEGTPLPAGSPVATPPEPPPPPVEGPLPLPTDGPVPVDPQTSGPPLAAAKYNPDTGEYLGSDGRWYRQSSVVDAAPTSWTDLMPQQ